MNDLGKLEYFIGNEVVTTIDNNNQIGIEQGIPTVEKRQYVRLVRKLII